MNDGKVLNKQQAIALMRQFKDHPELRWELYNTGCEARADVMAEIAHELGLKPDKIWMLPYSDCTVSSYINKAKTERVIWSFHVAILLRVEVANEIRQLVFDPTLFDSPQEITDWCHRYSTNDQQTFYKVGDFRSYYGYTDMLTHNYREKVRVDRQKTLEGQFDLDDPVIFSGLLQNQRGQLVDDMLHNDNESSSDFQNALENIYFVNFIKSCITSEELKTTLEENQYYYAIPCAELKSSLDFNDPFVFLQLVNTYWQAIETVLINLKKAADHLKVNERKETRFNIEWETEKSFSKRWFKPHSNNIWSEWNVSLVDLRVRKHDYF